MVTNQLVDTRVDIEWCQNEAAGCNQASPWLVYPWHTGMCYEVIDYDEDKELSRHKLLIM